MPALGLTLGLLQLLLAKASSFRQVQRIVAGIVACDPALLAVPRPSNYVKAQSSIEAWPKKPKQP